MMNMVEGVNIVVAIHHVATIVATTILILVAMVAGTIAISMCYSSRTRRLDSMYLARVIGRLLMCGMHPAIQSDRGTSTIEAMRGTHPAAYDYLLPIHDLDRVIA
jgi:hypothetical protein